MKRIAHCLAVVPLATIALSGCTSGSSANENEHENNRLLAGVSEQGQVLAAELAARGGSTASGDWTAHDTAEAIDDGGQVVEKQALNPYYSTFFHYAGSSPSSQGGTYTPRATLGAPSVNRHGEEAEGPALAEGPTVELAGVELGPQ